TLEKIIEHYASGKYNCFRREISLEESIKNSREIAFSDINIILIYLARAKANGLENVIDKEFQNKFLGEIQAAIHVFYLLLFLGKDIHPDNIAVKKFLTEGEREAH